MRAFRWEILFRRRAGDEADVGRPEARPVQLLFGTQDDAVVLRSDLDHVHGPARVALQAQAPPLSDGEELDSWVAAKEPALRVDHLAGLGPDTIADEGAVVVVGYEAYLLPVRLVCHGETGVGRDEPDLLLGVSARRQHQPGQLALRQREQHVGLVLGGVRALEQLELSILAGHPGKPLPSCIGSSHWTRPRCRSRAPRFSFACGPETIGTGSLLLGQWLLVQWS